MKKLLLVIAALLAACCVASAQGALLKKLGQKAMGAAEKKLGQKVEQTVSKKVGEALGVEEKEAQAAQAASALGVYTGTGNPSGSTYAESLLDAGSGSGYFAPEIEKSSYSFKTYSQAMSARPTWATEAEISGKEGLESYLARLADYEKAVNELCSAYMAQQNALSEQSMKGVGTDARCDTIAVRLSEIYEKQFEGALSQLTTGVSSLQSLMLGGKAAIDENTLAGALFKLKKQIAAAWPRSQECHQVNVLEQQSQSKESRSRQNEIIDSWNKQQLQRWLSTIKRFDEKNGATALRIAELDAELESMGAATRKTSSWASAKSMAATLNGLVINYTSMPHLLFDCPLVRHAWED